MSNNKDINALIELADKSYSSSDFQSVINILNDVEDSLAAGLTIEEVARENKLTIEKLDPFDAVGLTKDNKNIVFEPIVD